jgi:hypothetical protein
VEYTQLGMCTLHYTNSWASADRVYSFVQLSPSLILGAYILRLLPRQCRNFFFVVPACIGHNMDPKSTILNI